MRPLLVCSSAPWNINRQTTVTHSAENSKISNRLDMGILAAATRRLTYSKTIWTLIVSWFEENIVPRPTSRMTGATVLDSSAYRIADVLATYYLRTSKRRFQALRTSHTTSCCLTLRTTITTRIALQQTCGIRYTSHGGSANALPSVSYLRDSSHFLATFST